MRERFALAGCWWKTDGGENNPIVYLFLDEENVQTWDEGNLGPGGPFLAVEFVKASSFSILIHSVHTYRAVILITEH